jgi:hypothetical protein
MHIESARPICRIYLCNRERGPWTDDLREEAFAVVRARFPSFTVQEAMGFFEGKSMPTLVIIIASSDLDPVFRVADELRTLMDQRGVGVEHGGLYLRLVAGQPG